MAEENPKNVKKWKKIIYPTTPLTPRARRDFKEKRESWSDKKRNIEVLKDVLKILERNKEKE